jgi:hypothetical protein
MGCSDTLTRPRPTVAHRGPAAVGRRQSDDRGRPRPTTPIGVGPAAVVGPRSRPHTDQHQHNTRGPR